MACSSASSPTLLTKPKASRKLLNRKDLLRWCSSATSHSGTCCRSGSSCSPLRGGTPPLHGTHVLLASSVIPYLMRNEPPANRLLTVPVYVLASLGRTVVTPISPEPLRVPLCVLDLGSLHDRIRVPADILPIVVVGARECLVFELVFEVDHYAAYQREDFLVGCAS